MEIAMPMKALLADAGYDPDTVTVLVSSFETAWNKLVALNSPHAESMHAEATRERLAKQIILSWQMGEYSEERLAASALASLPSTDHPFSRPD